MDGTSVDRPYQSERTDEITPTVNGRGTYQDVLFILLYK